MSIARVGNEGHPDHSTAVEPAAVSPRTRSLGIALVAALAVLQFAVTWWMLTPGYLFLDEVWYHWMTRDFSATGGLELWNGYDELPSPELTPANLPALRGRIVSRYPYLFPVLALPLYRAFGYVGLIIVNSAAFVAVVLLCYAIARRLFHDHTLAIRACLLFVFATFVWSYSQDAWPHTTALLFLEAAFYLMLRAYDVPGTRAALVWAACSGLVAGFAPGIRIDNALAFPGLVGPLIFARPWRLREALSFAAAALPGLGILAWTNLIKFGHFSPFSYGGGTHVSWGLSAAVVAAGATIWMLSRPFSDGVVRRKSSLLVLAGLAFLAAAFAVPDSRNLLLRALRDFWVSVIDVRVLDPGVVLPPLERTSGGGMVYVAAMKKSLLQSLPYLPLVLIPILMLKRGGRDAAAILMLLVIPICFAGYYSLFTHQYGGLCYNFRYFIPVLPFAAILSAYALREMTAAWGPPSLFLLVIPAGLAVAAFFAWTGRSGIPLNDLEFPLLVVPLIMAAALVFLLVAAQIVGTEGARPIRAAAWVATAVAIAWAGLGAFFYDLPSHRDIRVKNAKWADTALRTLPANSIYFAFPIVSPSIVDGRGIRIAFPAEDNGKDFLRLLEFHLKAGRRAFAAFTVDFWNGLKAGRLRDFDVTPIYVLPAQVVLAEISRSEKRADRPE